MLKGMPRPKSPDGKRVPMSTRFSEPESAEIDAARGSMERGPWLRLAALTALERQQKPSVPAARQAKPGACPHRLLSGAYCKICQRTKS